MNEGAVEGRHISLGNVISKWIGQKRKPEVLVLRKPIFFLIEVVDLLG